MPQCQLITLFMLKNEDVCVCFLPPIPALLQITMSFLGVLVLLVTLTGVCLSADVADGVFIGTDQNLQELISDSKYALVAYCLG